jgi:hypothetical protein
MTQIEAFIRFLNRKNYATSLYKRGYPVGVYIDNAWCYFSVDSFKQEVTVIPQPLQMLFEEFKNRSSKNLKKPIKATYIQPLPTTDGQPERRRLRIKRANNPDG